MSNRLSPYIVAFSPDAVVTELKPELRISWSVDVETSQFSNSATLPFYVTVHNESTGANIPLTYVEYDADTKTVVLEPTNNLFSGVQYRITVKQGVLSTERRSSANTRTWVFEVGSSGLTTPGSLQPDSYKTYTTFPTLTWADTATTYRVEIATDPGFTSPVESRVISDPSFTTSLSYDLGVSYYWRVIGISGSVSSDWSDIGVFRYDNAPPADDSTQTFESYQPFTVETCSFEDNHSHLSAYPTISFTFTEDFDSDLTSSILTWKSKTSHSNLSPSTQGRLSWAGTWSVSGKTVTFTPSSAIENNTRYFVEFPKGLVSDEGHALFKKLTYFFTGAYTPYYASYDMVASRYGPGLELIDPDLVNYFIHEASKNANHLFYTALTGYTYQVGPEGIAESQVEINSLQSHSLRMWVTCEAILLLVKRILSSELLNIGRETKIGPFSESLSSDFLKGLDTMFKATREEQVMWTSQVYGTPNIYTVSNYPY